VCALVLLQLYQRTKSLMSKASLQTATATHSSSAHSSVAMAHKTKPLAVTGVAIAHDCALEQAPHSCTSNTHTQC